jgi:AAHS family 4-hydroxybenzoate transporter-like MFS transporter
MAVTVDVAEIIEKQKFGAFQISIVALCGCVQFLDGFDTQALAYAAPTLRAAWHMSPTALGPVFGFGAFGTGIGSVLLSPLADMFGRKKVMIASVLLFGLFTLATVAVGSVNQLLILRPLTGFGLGAALPLTYVVANEFAPARIRARMVAIMATGFAIGAAFGGLLQAQMAPMFGWQGIFFAGGLVPLLVASALALFLPESVRYLVTRGGRANEVAATLARIDPSRRFTPDMNFILPAEPKKKGVRVVQLFREGRAAMSVLLWLTYLVTLAMLNTLNNWLPVALNEAGLPVGQAVRLTTLFQFGGIAGVLALGTLADMFGFHRVLIAGFILLTVFVALTGSVGASVPLLAIAVAGTGLCLVGANNTLNAFATTLYPTDIRSTGISWASSFGRFVGGLGPIMGGVLLANLPLQTVFFVFACPALVGAFSVLGLLRNHRADPPEEPARAPYFTRS